MDLLSYHGSVPHKQREVVAVEHRASPTNAEARRLVSDTTDVVSKPMAA